MINITTIYCSQQYTGLSQLTERMSLSLCDGISYKRSHFSLSRNKLFTVLNLVNRPPIIIKSLVNKLSSGSKPAFRSVPVLNSAVQHHLSSVMTSLTPSQSELSISEGAACLHHSRLILFYK